MEIQGFIKGIFSGYVQEELLFPYPTFAKDEKETVKIILNSIKDLSAKYINTKKIRKNKKLSSELKKELKDIGLYGLILPIRYGGSGLSVSAYLRVIEELSRHSFSIATRVSTHQVMGGLSIALKGSPYLKEKYLKDIALGKKLTSYALTESKVGSNIRSIRMSATYIPEKRVYKLKGTKVWVFNAPEAEIFITFAKTVSPKDDKNKNELTAFVVERKFGVKTGKPENLAGLDGLEASEVYFDDILVPEENIISKEGDGFAIAVEVLNFGRLELSAEALGLSKKAIKYATDYALSRKQFGHPISEYEMIKDKISHMTISTYILESMLYLTAGIIDANFYDFSAEAAACKVYASEHLVQSIDLATSICSSVSYIRDHWLAQTLKDSRMMFFYQGTNEVLRLFLAYSGISHSEDKEEISLTKTLMDPIKSLTTISNFLVKRISSTILANRLLRVDDLLKREAAIIEEVVEKFSITVEGVVERYGNDFINHQFVLKRIADASIYIYAMSATISRVSALVLDTSKEQAIKEIEIAIHVSDHYKKKILSLLSDVTVNKDDYLRDISRKIYKYKSYPYDILK